MDAIELEIGGGWIGSAYSPQVSVTDTEDGHRVEFTYDDAEDGVSTVGYDVPDWSDEEEARADAERQRQQAESERSQAEAQRAAAESLRASAESSRVSAEASREDAEEAREGAEAARQAAFEQAEAQRAAGEQSRVQAESQRVSAEAARQEAMAGAVERSQQAAQRADEAYQEASQASQGANDAATRASASATQADQAATRATESADAADASRAAADQATASANSAATAADDAAQSATAAAQAATTATTDANAATANANDAAQSASASATAADTAAESANDASARAEAAIEAIGDISELAVPLMSETTRGGATLGQGLTVDGGALSIGDVVTDETDGPIYSVDAKGWAEQDGTPTPDNPVEVRVCRGRNLLPNSVTTRTVSGVTLTVNADKSITVNGTASSTIDLTIGTMELHGGSYVLSGCPSGGAWSIYCLQLTDNPVTTNKGIDAGSGIAITLDEGSYNVRLHVASGQNVSGLTFKPQLELGSTPTPYVPYGHVGLEVRDLSDELVSVTPIPLPSKGFAAALPDGTADVLAIDSAGGVEWENATDEKHDDFTVGSATVQSDDTTSFTMLSGIKSGYVLSNIAQYNGPNNARVVNSNGTVYMRFPTSIVGSTNASVKAWVDANCEVLYPLATPTTEHAYIDLPEVPENATITIPELREVGVKCFVPGVSELIDHANNWGARCKQNESRIAALEAAIANLATS